MGLTITFATPAEKSKFLRLMQLLTADVSELSGTLGILIALSRHSDDHALVSVLNRNARFWHSLFNSLYMSSFVMIARIHDSAHGAYLRKIKQALHPKAMSDVLERFDNLEADHSHFIAKVLSLRETAFFRERITFELDGVRRDRLEAYWRDLTGATKFLEAAVFVEKSGQRFDAGMLQDDVSRANRALNSLRST
jgi:hypothetical protein